MALYLPCYLLIDGYRSGFMPFSKALVWTYIQFANYIVVYSIIFSIGHK